jgi:hypothetical protein
MLAYEIIGHDNLRYTWTDFNMNKGIINLAPSFGLKIVLLQLRWPS